MLGFDDVAGQRLFSWLFSHLTHLPPNGCKPTHFCWAPNLRLVWSRGCRLPGEWSIGFIRYRNTAGVKRETWRMRPEVPSFEQFLGFDMCIVLKCMSCFPHCFPSFFFQFQMTWKLVVFESFSNFAGFNSQMFDQIPPICWVIDFIEKKRKDLDVFTLHGWCGYLEIFTKTLKPCVFVLPRCFEHTNIMPWSLACYNC